jgi:hypothetical protein
LSYVSDVWNAPLLDRRRADYGHGHHHLQTVSVGTGDWLMLTLLGSLLGFLGSAFPQLLKLFQDGRSNNVPVARFAKNIN